jgi:hypothetical protein
MKKMTSILTGLVLAFGLTITATPASANSQAGYDVSAYYRADLGYMVGWKTPENKTGITGYTVIANPGGKTCVVRGSATNVCTYRASDLGYVNTYTFTVVTNNGSAVVATSAASNAITPASIPVAPLVATSQVASDTSIDVAWIPSSSTGGAPLYGYKITYWKSDNGGNPINSTKAELVVSNTYVTLTGLSPSTMYVINVASCNAYGCNSADRWSYTPTTPITSAVTNVKLPRVISGGSASTTCFESIFDANTGESSTGATCGAVVGNPSNYPVVIPSATQINDPVLPTKFANRAILSRFAPSYKLSVWAPIGISWFANLSATSKSVTQGFTTAVNIYSMTPAVCEVVGSKINLKTVGFCDISAVVEGNGTFLTSNVARARINVVN